MNILDINEADLAALKSDGYTEFDLSQLAASEVQNLLPQADDAGDDEVQTVTPAPAAAAVVEEEVEQVESDTFIPQYSAEVPTDAAAQIKALKTEERTAFKQLMDGEIDSEEYSAIRDRTETETDDLKTKALTASIFQQANAQAAEQAAKKDWDKAEKSLFEVFKAEGLAYKDKPSLLAAYNTNLRALGSDPKNDNRDAAWFLSEAHKLTKADLGFVAQTNTAANSKKRINERVDVSELPPILRSVPASATGAVNSDEFASLRHLMETDAIGFERAVARLSNDQRDRWMEE